MGMQNSGAAVFRQFFDPASSTFTYLLAGERGGEAVLIDPVLENVPQYLAAIEQLDLRLVHAIDTHVHADHITGLGALRDQTACVTMMGQQTTAECVSRTFADGDRIRVGPAGGAAALEIEALYTPGHTDDSYCFLLPGDRLFTGDTLLINGSGRTDFQNGDAGAQYDSIFGRLLKLPDETRVYPGHDYRGNTVSTIGAERANNPRLQVASRAEYVELMNGLELPNPRLMDIAVPANQACGRVDETNN